jgi:hypothetical protein
MYWRKKQELAQLRNSSSNQKKRCKTGILPFTNFYFLLKQL